MPRRYYIIAILAAVLAAGAALLIGGEGMRPRAADQSEALDQAPVDSFESGFQFAGDKPGEALAAYRAFAVYPPHSRPLTRQMKDLLQPNIRYEQPKRVFENRERGEEHYLFTADRYIVWGQGSILFTLKATDSALSSQPVSGLKVVSVQILAGRKKQSVITRIELNDAGRDGDSVAGDNVYSFRLYPSQAFPARHERLFARAEFEVRRQTVVSEISFEVHPAVSAAGEFTGRFTEAVEDGSLVIYPEVRITKAGFFIFDANLFTENGEPVCHSRFKGELKPGLQQIRLEAFGKVLHDSDASGTFVLRDLRGYRVLNHSESPGTTVDKNLVFPDAELRFDTRSYDLSVFSNREWDSPQKQARIRLLEEAES